MTDYVYDETGIMFDVFLMAIIFIILIPLTLSVLKKQPKKKQKSFTSDWLRPLEPIRKATEKKEPVLNWRFALVGFLASSFCLLGYRVATTEIATTDLWDPFVILAISPGTSEEDIKRAYKKMALKFHPDRLAEDEKEEGQIKFIEISKAYKVLTNEEYRKNYEEYGHPDGKQSMSVGIALPEWTKHPALLGLYVLAFGGLLPFLVHRWWKSSKNMTRDNIRLETMAVFFKEVKENITVKSLIEVLASAKEFEECEHRAGDKAAIDKLYLDIQASVKFKGGDFDNPKKLNSDASMKAFMLLHAHFNRVPISNDNLLKDYFYILPKAVLLVTGMLNISSVHSWLQTSLMIMEISQMLVQAVPYQESGLAVLPHVDARVVKSLKSRKKPIVNVSQLLEMKEEERRQLFKEMEASKYDTMIDFAQKKVPVIAKLEDEFYVEGDDLITPSSLLTFRVKMRVSSYKDKDKEHAIAAQENEDASKRWLKTLNGNEEDPSAWQVQSDYFPERKFLNFWVMLGNPTNNRIIMQVMKLTGSVEGGVVKIQFPAPAKPGKYSLTLFAKSDSYPGLNIRKEVSFFISAKPKEEEPEEEIDEEDEVADEDAEEITDIDTDDDGDFVTTDDET